MSTHRPLHIAEASGDTLSARSVAFSAFSDVDEQARAFDGWDLNYTQISRGLFHGSSSVVSLGGIRLLVEHLDKVILQRGSVPSDRLAVAVPLELEGHARMCGEMSQRDSLHIFSGVPEFEFYSPDRHILVNIEIEPERLSSEQMSVLAATLRTKALPPVVPMATEVADNMRNLLRQTLAVSTRTTQADREKTLDCIELFERTILYAISEVVSVAAPGNVRLSKYWPLVRSIQEKLQNSVTCPLSIAELCAQLGLSRRTVQYAFRDALNLNPAAYLRAVRLNHVRRDLRHGETVTTAATNWGFWHLGSFANDYRNMFGELPSTTVKRRLCQVD